MRVKFITNQRKKERAMARIAKQEELLDKISEQGEYLKILREQ